MQIKNPLLPSEITVYAAEKQTKLVINEGVKLSGEEGKKYRDKIIKITATTKKAEKRRNETLQIAYCI